MKATGLLAIAMRDILYNNGVLPRVGMTEKNIELCRVQNDLPHATSYLRMRVLACGFYNRPSLIPARSYM